MAEWSIAAVLKTVVRATGPGVRIPLSPQTNITPVPSMTEQVFCFTAERARLAGASNDGK